MVKTAFSAEILHSREACLHAIRMLFNENDRPLLEHTLRLFNTHDFAHPMPLDPLQNALSLIKILHGLTLDTHTLMTGLLVFFMETSDLDEETLSLHLPEEVTALWQGVSHMDHLNHQCYQHPPRESSQSDKQRNLLVAMVDDPRIVLIKLSEHIVRLQNAIAHESPHQTILAKQTEQIFAPLANRLGVYQLKWILEDLAFRIQNPEAYKALAQSVSIKRHERESIVENSIQSVYTLFQKEAGFSFEIRGRAKHLFSIHKKMQKKRCSFEEVYDALAIRIFVEDIPACYKALSLIESLWEDCHDEFDDYIAAPKPNGYQSIHATVLLSEKIPLEVQIRTHQMHEDAELGVAAHWHYKQGGNYPSQDQKLSWLRSLLSWQADWTPPAFHTQASQFVYVFTPQGEIKSFQDGATCLDFAYSVHSSVGHRCKGAKINQKIVPLNTCLNTGDTIEILTRKEEKPSRDWLNPNLGYLRSSKARAKISLWFKSQDLALNQQRGQQLLKDLKKSLKLEKIDLETMSHRLDFQSIDAFYAALGCGDCKLPQVKRVIQKIHPELPKPTELKTTPQKTKHIPSDLLVEGEGKLLTHFAQCCHPLPGDSIVGYLTLSKGISIHRQDCQNILFSKHPERMLSVSWSEKLSNRYVLSLAILCDHADKNHLSVIDFLARKKIKVVSHQKKSEQCFSLSLEISGIGEVDTLIELLYHFSFIHAVNRI